MITVVCVLRSGPRFVDKQPYTAEHVVKLKRGVDRWLEQPHMFLCLTDQEHSVLSEGIDVVSLQSGWTGWWSKIELFRPDLFTGPTLYFDLDSLIVGPLDALVRAHKGLTMVRDFGWPQCMNSSVMAWCGDQSAIWHRFSMAPGAIMKEYDGRGNPTLGDQGFIHETLGSDAIDTFNPAHVVSFKRQARQAAPADARVLSFHGSPKCDDPKAGWAYQAWREL